MIKGLIFDMDGLLIDTESLSYEALRLDLEAQGKEFTLEQFLPIRSHSVKKCEEIFKGYYGEDFDFKGCFERHILYMNEHIDKYGLPLKKGARELLRFGKEQGLTIALATGTPLDTAKRWLESVELWNYFDEFQSSAFIEHGKPAPDVYLATAKLMGLKPCECMAFEDSPNGVRSASSAGCVTVMIPDLSGADEELSKLIYAEAESLDKAIDVINNYQK
ncbi:MAG: HAD family hydrolase [Ruminococcus sp.]